MRTPPNESLSSDIVEAPKARKASEPERRCVISGQTGPREKLVRLAVSPSGLVLPDAQEKARRVREELVSVVEMPPPLLEFDLKAGSFRRVA